VQRPEVIAWVLSLCADLRLSQAKILADRGFGRAELAKTCREPGLSFVIRDGRAASVVRLQR
jgi:hypothetical protein